MDLKHPFRGSTLIDLVLHRGETQADELAFRHLRDGQLTPQTVTYGEFARRVQTLGAYLQGQCDAGDRVILAYPPGIDYMVAYFAIIFAGAIATPVFGPRQSTHANRLHGILDDARPSLMLSDPQTRELTDENLLAHVDQAGIRWLCPDETAFAGNAAHAWKPIAARPDSVVFLQYTSGSTGSPKGVMVTHGNLIENARTMALATRAQSDFVMVNWLPPYHDMGLIGGLIEPLFCGYPSIMLNPISTIQRPLRWLKAISDYRASLSGGPNFIYDACLHRISDAALEGLDLSSWKIAFNGAEPISARTVTEFSKRFAACGFSHSAHFTCYGLAENTLMASNTDPAEPPRIMTVDKHELQCDRVQPPRGEVMTLVSSGRVSPGVGVKIVDPARCCELPAGQVGEIWITGPSVAAGYWQRAETPGEGFFGLLEGDSRQRYLRSGDLGFMSDGDLFVTGRIKDLIIIRGVNHYPQDIERTVTSAAPELKPHTAAAFSHLSAEGEQLAVMLEVKPTVPKERRAQILDDIQDAVFHAHQIKLAGLVFVRPGTLPKTTSGKIQRRAALNRYVAMQRATPFCLEVADAA